MNNKNYIKIPTIISLRVINYPLFNYHNHDHWAFQMQDGINLMLGANSIGKTTTMNMIKFAFVGSCGEINSMYFSERIKAGLKKTKNQYIVLEYILNGKLIEIHRNLLSGELDKFIIDNIEKSTSAYLSFLEENTKVNPLKFTALLELMLIRVEEGNYILWDKPSQTTIISALLNDVEFQEQFHRDEETFKELEDKCKSILNLLNDKQNREIDLRRNIENEQRKQGPTINIEVATKELENCNFQKSTLIKDIAESQIKLTAEKDGTKNLYENFEDNRVKFRLIQTQTEYAEIEIKRLKESVVSSNIDTNCILCTTIISHEKAIQIHKQYFIDKICPACESSLGESLTIEDPKIIANKLSIKQGELRSLKEQLFNVKKEYETAEHKKNNNEKTLNSLRQSIEVKEKELYSLKIKILDLLNTIDLLKQKKPNQPTNYDVLLLKIGQEILELKIAYKTALKQKSDYVIKISKQRHARNEIIRGFYEKLNSIFKRYSQEYFVENCELEFYDPSNNKGITQIYNFAPRLEEVTRKYKKNVSHSEAVFLEYLFRVSLLELYFEETGSKPFLFLETSEGVFDVANTESAAKLFSKFAIDKFPVIIVSNLSKEEEFIDVLFNKDTNDKKERLFNLIHYGKLTPRQQQNKQLKLYFGV